MSQKVDPKVASKVQRMDDWSVVLMGWRMAGSMDGSSAQTSVVTLESPMVARKAVH